MIYVASSTLLFSLLFGVSASQINPASAPLVTLVTGFLMLLSLTVPRQIQKYSLRDPAPTVLSRLVKRGTVGSGIACTAVVISVLLTGGWGKPEFVGEVYLWGAMGVFLFQVVGEVLTNHVLYLQRTNQYNSNQLFALLLGLGLVLFILVLYFVAFDLSRAPAWHPYLRDMLAVTLVVLGYGRAVFLMAHH